jgi:hypothetical protein
MNRLTLVAFFGLLGLSPIFSQNKSIFNQVLGATGRTGVNQGRLFAYTVGEVAVWTGIGTARILTQGFHQPEQTRLVYVGEPDLSAWDIAVFPNPTADVLNIRFDSDKGNYLMGVVLDAVGRVMFSGERLYSGDTIDCRHWQPGLYFLLLTDPASRASATARFIRL